MFPELVLAHGRLMSCWGLWHGATPFFSIYILFWVSHSAFFPFGSLCMEYLWMCLLCLCVCVLNLDHVVCLRTLLPEHLTPPALAFTPPTPHICSCVFAIAASGSQPLHFFLLHHWKEIQNKGEKVGQFPPLGSHTPTETHPRSSTLRTHAQRLAPLSDLYMSLSTSLTHRHNVELFESLSWGSSKLQCVNVLEVYWFWDLSPAACLFMDQNTSTWTLLDTTQTPSTPHPFSIPLSFTDLSVPNTFWDEVQKNVFTF